MISVKTLGHYSIKQLEQLSGVKAHTIRIWEQRYNLLSPNRTDTNIRYYDDTQLKKLLNVALLVQHGHKISKISSLPVEGIKSLINQEIINEVQDTSIDSAINALLLSMIDYDDGAFEKIFSDSILRRGFEKTITDLIYPFLARVGIMWGINEVNPAQEHFVSNLIRQKIIVAINGISSSPRSDKTFLLFLPEGELHEMGLLMAHYILKLSDIKVIYLGQNVPFKDVLETYNACKPSHLFTFITNFSTDNFENNPQEFISNLSSQLTSCNILLGGRKDFLDELNIPKNVKILSDIPSLKELL